MPEQDRRTYASTTTPEVSQDIECVASQLIAHTDRQRIYNHVRSYSLEILYPY